MITTHDFHIHTSLSFCAKESATLKNYIDISKRIGLKKIGIANHFWDSAIPRIDTYYKTKYDVGFYDHQDFHHILQVKPEIERYQNEGIEIYFGAEAEYDPIRKDVGITQEVAEQLDFLLVPNSHTHATMPIAYYEPYDRHVQFMIDAYNDIIDSNVSRYITAIAHPFSAVACPYPKAILYEMISDDCFKRLFDKTAGKGIAVEINTGVFRGLKDKEIEENPRVRMFRIAKECGCKFIFGSDAHSDTAHDDYIAILEKLTRLLELSERDIADIAL